MKYSLNQEPDTNQRFLNHGYIIRVIMDRKCEKDKCNKEGNYSSKIGYFCLDHILDYDMACPNDDCPRKGLAMDKLISEIKKDINGDLHQIFLCQSCGYRHDHTVNV